MQSPFLVVNWGAGDQRLGGGKPLNAECVWSLKGTRGSLNWNRANFNHDAIGCPAASLQSPFFVGNWREINKGGECCGQRASHSMLDVCVDLKGPGMGFNWRCLNFNPDMVL